MEQATSNVDRVKAIKQNVFLEPSNVEALNQLIEPDAIIESSANFNK